MKPIIALVSTVCLTGCADQLVSNDHIRDSTAFVLNVPAQSVLISDRRYDGEFLTVYTATTPQGVFHCSIGGGSVRQMGITEPPVCGSISTPAPIRHRRGRISASR